MTPKYVENDEEKQENDEQTYLWGEREGDVLGKGHAVYSAMCWNIPLQLWDMTPYGSLGLNYVKGAQEKKTERKRIEALTTVIFEWQMSFFISFFVFFLVVSNFLQWTYISFIIKESKKKYFVSQDKPPNCEDKYQAVERRRKKGEKKKKTHEV